MNKKKCPQCGAVKTKKNGTRKGVQLYKCLVCRRQFRWCSIAGNGNVECLSKRQTNYPPIIRTNPFECLIHQTQTTQSPTERFLGAIHTTIFPACKMTYTPIKGIIIDGKKALFKEFQDHPMQMCQFHMLQIVRRYLTGNPKMKASIDLMLIMREMKHLTKEVFEAEYAAWKERYTEFLNKRVTHKDGKSCYLHRKVRMVVHSIDFYLPYLFTFQCPECAGMPNTNNKIEGTFTDLKKSLNNHTGMSMQNRKRFISSFFLQRLN